MFKLLRQIVGCADLQRLAVARWAHRSGQPGVSQHSAVSGRQLARLQARHEPPAAHRHSSVVAVAAAAV